MKICILCLVAFIPCIKGASLSRDETDEHDVTKREAFDMVDYLERYGYLSDQYNSPEDGNEVFHSEAELIFALRRFQDFNGLPVTGRMDRKTRDLMKKPRCGFKDIFDDADPNQPQKFSHLGRKWPNNQVTWKSVGWTNKLPIVEQKRAMVNAFQYWADVTPLTFTSTEGTPDIEIKFARGEHGDGYGNAFDGKGRTLAHAFGPGSSSISGDTHFDNDEDWTYHESRGTELETVAAHEFGHAIGLGHSSVSGSLMAPYYQGYDPNFKLHDDDIRGIQLLYGSNPNGPKTTTTTTSPPTTPQTTTTKTTTTKTTTTKTTTTDPDFCSTKLDAVVTASDGFTYAFRYKQVFKLGSRGLEEGYPKPIRQVYPRAPSKIRGGFYLSGERKTYLFKGSRLWRYTDFELDEGFPKTIYTENFPEKVHAVIAMKDGFGKHRIFMFGSVKFWEWNPATLQMVPNWSYNIVDHWRGIPKGVEAAVTWYDGNMYFFKGMNFRKFDSYYRSVENGYPMRWSPVWMRNVCSGSAQEVKEAEMQWDTVSKMADIGRNSERGKHQITTGHFPF